MYFLSFFFLFALIVSSKPVSHADLEELNTPEIPTKPPGHKPIDNSKCYKMTANGGEYGTFYVDPTNKHLYGGLDLGKALANIELPSVVPPNILDFNNLFAVLSADVDFIADAGANVTKINVTGIRPDTYLQFTGANVMLGLLGTLAPGLAVLNGPLYFPTVLTSVDQIIEGLRAMLPKDTIPADFKFDMSLIVSLFPMINQMFDGLYLDSTGKPGFLVAVSPTVVVVGSGESVDCKAEKKLPYGTKTIPITGLNFVFVNDPLPGVYSFNPKTGLDDELTIVVASSDYTSVLPTELQKGSYSFRLKFLISLQNDKEKSTIDYSKVSNDTVSEYMLWAKDEEAAKVLKGLGAEGKINVEARMGDLETPDFVQLNFVPLHNKILELAKATFKSVGLKKTITISGEKGKYKLADGKDHDAVYRTSLDNTKELKPEYVPPIPDDASYYRIFLTLCITLMMCFIL